MTGQPNAQVRFRRAIVHRALRLAEDAARELGELPLEDALMLVHLYAERGSPKYERAAMRWRERYLAESSPTLPRFARVVAELASGAEECMTRTCLTIGRCVSRLRLRCAPSC